MPCDSCGTAGSNSVGNYGVSAYVNIGVQPTLSHGDCEGVSIGLLQMFLRLIKCVIEHDVYTSVNITSTEAQNAKTLLEDWITQKQADPATCVYQEKLPLLQAIIQRIVIFGRC